MPLIFFLILESIGTQELILVGLVALIVFGPRKLPQMARKFGGMLTELKKVSTDFRQTWEKEASLDAEGLLSTGDAKIKPDPIPAEESISRELSSANEELRPEIREVSTEEFENLKRPLAEDSAATLDPDPPEDKKPAKPSDKRSWL